MLPIQMEYIQKFTANHMRPGTETLEHLTKKIAKDGSIFLASSVLGNALNIGLHIFLGRRLGTNAYGIYTLGYSVFVIISQFSMFGFQNGIVRFVSLYKGVGDTKKVKGTLILGFAASTAFSIIIGSLLFILSDFISIRLFNKPNLSSVLRIFSVSLTFYVLMIMSSFSARAFQVIQYDVGVRNISFPMLNLISVAVAFLLGLKLLGAMYAFLVSAFLSAFLGFFFIKRIFPEIFSELKPAYEFRRIFRFSLPVFLIGFSYVVLTQIARIMLGYFMNSDDLGVYNAAIGVAMLSVLILNSVSAIFSPIISDIYNRNKLKELESLFKISTRWIFTLTLPMIVIMIIFSKKILDSLFGAEFIGGWIVLATLCTSNLIANSTGSVGIILQMTGKQDIELVNTITTVMVNIGLSIWLIKVYGIFGAALAAGISLALINIVKLIEVYKLIGMHPYNRKYLKPIVSGILAAILCLIMNNLVHGRLWLVSVFLFLAIYFAVLYLFGLAEEDKMIIATGMRNFQIGL